jgi:hypothetical protein
MRAIGLAAFVLGLVLGAAVLDGALWYGGDIRWPLAWSTQHAAAAIAARQATSLPDMRNAPTQPPPATFGLAADRGARADC